MVLVSHWFWFLLYNLMSISCTTLFLFPFLNSLLKWKLKWSNNKTLSYNRTKRDIWLVKKKTLNGRWWSLRQLFWRQLVDLGACWLDFGFRWSWNTWLPDILQTGRWNTTNILYFLAPGSHQACLQLKVTAWCLLSGLVKTPSFPASAFFATLLKV